MTDHTPILITGSAGYIGSHVTDKDMEMRSAFRRSIVAAKPIKAGAVIERADLDFKRPGRGIPPNRVNTVIVSVASRDIAADEVLEDDAFKSQ